MRHAPYTSQYSAWKMRVLRTMRIWYIDRLFSCEFSELRLDWVSRLTHALCSARISPDPSYRSVFSMPAAAVVCCIYMAILPAFDLHNSSPNWLGTTELLQNDGTVIPFRSFEWPMMRACAPIISIICIQTALVHDLHWPDHVARVLNSLSFPPQPHLTDFTRTS